MALPDQSSPAPQQSTGDGGYRPGYEIAAELILEYIVREQLPPGARLPTEKDLADEVRMSRTVVREAVKILSALGRLSVQKGRGIYVAEPDAPPWREPFSQFLPADVHQVEELFEFRLHVETIAAQLAAQRAAPAQVKVIREAAKQSAQAAERSDIEAFTQADEDFHGGIGAAAANKFFASTVESVRQLQRQVSAIGLAGVAGGSLTAAADQHQAIAEAIASGDEALATTLMAEHIDTTKRQFEQEIRRRLLANDTRPA
ncbi:FadR/GntR family transcriptional regulator [Streptomyces sp. NBC_01618]|uniref:FadR/GntR family transcriptional regulator n=1 Tax=Streptomyces sp. NBC_01618 TaxID=2975900 RepID=UPI00386EF573|nr:FCD domain-containing protein [Streptomyces sp. NBC_01618]